ncbi:hypothetical protein O0I10_002996 [Lichtheimia ornata]|uniref:Uncharacterized protein n=1 Tax=Lichtheimia ornata TaxID=688661 RepID=A0AAD7VB76_9FUNG|nr:uncharacterized protein O0I10_002996 [Lichtheimia ornata]KAJ8661247.1 hypothetical protein O0I10_002996 [Lichtheimia ornata]
MSVQATVALLNKNAAVNTNNSTTIATSAKPPINKIGGSTWKDGKDNRTSIITNKSARAAELERIRSTGGGVASMLSKFDRSEFNDTTPTTMKRNTTSGILSHRSSSLSRSSSVKQRSPKNYHGIVSSHNTSRIDAIMHDLVDMYQQAVEHCNGQHTTTRCGTTTTTRNVDNQQPLCKRSANKAEKGDSSCIASLDDDDDDNNKGAPNSRDDKEENDTRTSTDDDLLIVKKQLLAMEKGAQSVFERQARDLENERKQTRTLTEVVHKQEELIAALEGKVSSAQCERDELLLLQEQVELQQLEIKDKRNLLSRLLEEREEMFKLLRSQQSNYNNNGSMRSTSADLPSSERPHPQQYHRHLLSRASSPALRQTALVRSSSGLSSRPTSPPPLTAPPRDPLPPLPKSSFRGSSASSASTSSGSFLSPTTSWSSADYAAALAPVKLPDGIAASGYCGAPSDSQQQQQPVWLDYNSTHVDVLPPTPPGTIGRQPSFKFSRKRSSSNNSSFWKGWKQKLGSRS